MSELREAFVGRREELEQLRAALDTSRAGRGRLVLLRGEPGIGKTFTIAELASHAEREGVQVLWGRCHGEAGAPPYWPWTQVLRELIATLDEDELREDLGAGAPDVAEIIPELRVRLPGLGPALPPGNPAEARFRLFASLSHLFVAASRRRPRVIVLDDMHWADAPSLRFLRFLAPELEQSCLLFIGTYRENELSRSHPLSDALGDVARVAHAVRLRLAGLGVDEVHDLITIAAGTAPAARLVRSIHAQTEGNPLFLREIVLYLRDRGLLSGPAEARGQGLPASFRIPEGVREVIGQRLNLLPPACNEVLRVASVIGREFLLDILLRASGTDAQEAVMAAIDGALDARIVEEVGRDHYQFTHALVRMTLYDELRPGECRRLHQAVGEAIEAAHQHDLDPVLPELARHFHLAAQGGRFGRAIDYAARAGARADEVLAFEDAAGFFQMALDLMQQQEEPDPRVRGTMLLRLGEAQRKAGEFDQAKQTLHAAAAVARRHGFPDLLADAAISFELCAWRGALLDWEGAAGLLREALHALPDTEPGRRIRVMGALARSRLYSTGDAGAKAIALEAVALARTHGDVALTARTLSILLEFPVESEETEGSLAEATEMAEIAERAGDLELAAQAHFQCASHQLELGRMEECATAFRALCCVDRKMRQPVFFLFEAGFRATLALLRGDLAEAEAQIRQGLRRRTAGTTHYVDPFSVLIFALRREQGRLAEVGPLIAALSGRDSAASWRPGLALLHVELGNLDAARALFVAMTPGDFAVLPRDGRWTTCLAFLTETCAALGDAATAETLYRLLLPRAGRNIVFGNGSGCAGAADRFLGMLAATMGHWAAAEQHYVDAIAMNGRTGALAPLAHTHRDHAAMLLARGAPGDAERAGELLRWARESAEALGLAALLRKVEAQLAALPAQGPAADELTPREAEVLGLIAMGRTNADIALVLSIGVNTVATHVRNILAKTGCANRTEAAAYALRQGIAPGR